MQAVTYGKGIGAVRPAWKSKAFRNGSGEAWRKNYWSLARPAAGAGLHVPELATASGIHIAQMLPPPTTLAC
jgi:hypothetical protein